MTADSVYVRRSPEFENRLEGRYRGKGSEEISGMILRYNEDSSAERDSNLFTDQDTDSDPQFKIAYDFDSLTDIFPGPIPNELLDLVELAVAIRGVDRFIERKVVAGEGVDDSDARLNTRSIAIRFPVLSSSFASEEVENLVSTLVSYVTRDVVEFDLITHQYSGVQVQRTLGEPETRDIVSLFSGGLDSASGVYQNRSDNVNARYLSLRYGSGLGKGHGDIAAKLGIEPLCLGVEYKDTGSEFTDFSRGFLHWAFATAVAAADGAQEIRSYETGLMAQFALLSEGWQTTRTVAPVAVSLFNELIATATEYEISVTNPFLNETKTEVVERILDESIVRKAVSCPHHGKQNKYDLDNCGQCVPCIIRNIAVLESQHSISTEELSICNWEKVNFEDESMPPTQPFILPGRNDPDTFFLAFNEIAHLCRSIRHRKPREVVTEYPKIASPETYDLYQRFAEEFYSCLESLQSVNPTAGILLSP